MTLHSHIGLLLLLLPALAASKVYGKEPGVIILVEQIATTGAMLQERALTAEERKK